MGERSGGALCPWPRAGEGRRWAGRAPLGPRGWLGGALGRTAVPGSSVASPVRGALFAEPGKPASLGYLSVGLAWLWQDLSSCGQRGRRSPVEQGGEVALLAVLRARPARLCRGLLS